jgi:hypothetical protein
MGLNTEPVWRWQDLYPGWILGDADTGYLVAVRNEVASNAADGDPRYEVWHAGGGQRTLVRSGCSEIAGAAEGTRRWLVAPTRDCARSPGEPLIDVVAVSPEGRIAMVWPSVRVTPTGRGQDLGYVFDVRAAPAAGGIWIAAQSFAGTSDDHSRTDGTSILWTADGSAPRLVFARAGQDGARLDAMAPFGDDLVLGTSYQDHFGDTYFSLVVVARDGGHTFLARDSYDFGGFGFVFDLVGSPDGRELLIVGLDVHYAHVQVARLRRD